MRLGRIAPSVWILLAILIGLAVIVALRPLDRIQTEVTALLPAEERDPAVQLVRSFATRAQSETVLLVVEGLGEPTTRGHLWETINRELKQEPVFAEVWPLDPAQLDEGALERWRSHAVTWFWPHWWAEAGKPTDGTSIARSAVDQLEAFLARPESFAWEESIPEDPFLLVPASLSRLGEALPLTSESAPGSRARWWLRLEKSPFQRATQEALFAALDRVEMTVQAAAPETSLEFKATGAAFLAHASETEIRAEVYRLNWLVGLTVLALCAVILRQLRVFPPLLLILASSMVGGGLAVLLFNSRIHVITLVVGSILIGVAIDYGLHVFLESEVDSPQERWERVRRPLLVGSLSSVGGFALLLTTALPFLQQLGSFMTGGLLAALGSSLLFARRAPIIPDPVRVLPRFRLKLPRIVWGAVAIPALLLLAGLFRISWKDDIRELNMPLPEANTRDDEVQAAFAPGGEEAEAVHSLLLGPDWQSLHNALAEIARDRPVHSVAGWATPPDLMLEAQAAARQLDLENALRTEFDRRGFDPAAFAPFFEQWQEWTARPLDRSAAEATASAQLASLPGPARMLADDDQGKHWFLLSSPEPLAEVWQDDAEGSVRIVPLAALSSLNGVFTRYREQALRASLWGVAALGLGLLLGFGGKRGSVLLILPTLPTALALGLFGWGGDPLNLFHLLGGFLGVCLTLDYLVFATTAREHRRPLPASITLSALTTALSFGWLATSRIPAIAALGAVVALSVALAWALALLLTARPSEGVVHS